MSNSTPAFSIQSKLALAQEFIRAVESKNLDAVTATLAAEAQQFFMHTKRTKTKESRNDVISGRNRKAFCVALLENREEILAYTKGLFGKFTPLVWLNHEWSTSSDSNQVVFSAKGGMIVEKNGRPYKNDYVTIFEFDGDKIIRMYEYGDAFLYFSLRILPNRTELKSFVRAFQHLISSK
jgi:ketosteroid isomerase-like protein